MYPLYWTKPVKGVFLCVTVMSLRKCVLICTEKVCIQKLQKDYRIFVFAKLFAFGSEWKKNMVRKC